MARTETVLRVFVSSPSDVKEERTALQELIQELNNTWSKNLGVRLEWVGWETHTFPAAGSDPQAVINEQIADEYDIFVGLMWTRFGSPTARDGSGTAEEFHRAYERHRHVPNDIRVMFYFKDATVSPSEIDPEQLTSRKKFQDELGEKGVYYWTFISRDEFAQLARMHLGRQVQEWGKTWGVQTAPEGVVSTTIQKDEESADSQHDDEDVGLLDLIEEGQENFQSMTEALTRMNTAMEDLNSRVRSGAADLNRITAGGNIEVKDVKRISNRIAEALNSFAALMEADVPVVSASFSNGMDAYSRALTIEEFRPQNENDLNRMLSGIRMLQAVFAQSQVQMAEFRESIADTPRTTTMYNRAKKRALSILKQFEEELVGGLNLSAEVEKAIEQILRNGSGEA
ncbi:MAG TPA: DUF4062 domain-containing protein [Pyrinomonadaceae bacterium]|nr:DUF4062 domain-containing protein [Pyrinomonadaceae bacterium]